MNSRHAAAAQQENTGNKKQRNGEEKKNWQLHEILKLAIHRVTQKDAEFYEDERCVSTALSSALYAVQLCLNVHKCRINIREQTFIPAVLNLKCQAHQAADLAAWMSAFRFRSPDVGFFHLISC